MIRKEDENELCPKCSSKSTCINFGAKIFECKDCGAQWTYGVNLEKGKVSNSIEIH